MKHFLSFIVPSLLAVGCQTLHLSGSDKPVTATSLSDLADFYGYPGVIENGQQMMLKSSYSTFSFERGSRKSQFNGVNIWMNGPLEKKNSEWRLSWSDATKTIDPLLRNTYVLKDVGDSVIVLDPGHGGTDSGARGPRRVEEKRVVLDVAKRVRSKLRSSGMNVMMTREHDKELSLTDRTRMARQWKADLFVSIHINSAGNHSASGYETYCLSLPGYASTGSQTPSQSTYPGNQHDRANMVLAYYIQKGLLAYGKGADRGVKRARFSVLKDAPCPAALVECGFVTNSREENLMLQADYRDKLADGISNGILTYISQVHQAKQD
jgi:N-acetylmuramoyl-L-alanine amidase